jgi:hypothetical protein
MEWVGSVKKLVNSHDSSRSVKPVYSAAIEAFIGWLSKPKYGVGSDTGENAI